jgi:tetratricopeptide (TPR) repeat protein
LNIRCTLLLPFLLALPAHGSGQQETEPAYAAVVAAAQDAMGKSDFKTAAQEYQQAVKMHPESAEMWANLGLMEHESGDYAAAIRSFRQALQRKPSLYVPNLFLGLDSMRVGNTAGAVPFLLAAERLNKADPQPPLALGRAYSSSGKFFAAAQEFGRAIELDAAQSDAWLGQGMAYLDQVEADARRLSTEAPDSSYAQALYAEAMARQARYKEAAASFRTAMAAQPQPPCLHAQFGFMLAKQQNWQDARAEFSREPAACGIADFLAQEQASGKLDGDSYQSLTEASAHAKTPDKDCTAFLERKLPLRTDAEWLSLSACAYQAGNYSLASSASRQSPGPGGLYWSIKANQALAVRSLAHFEEIAPNSAASHVLLGDIYRQRQRFDDAQAQYKLALEISPADHAALLGLAYACFGKADIDGAIDAANSALVSNPADPELNLLLGDALIARHDFAGAEPFLQKALAAKPQMLPHVHALLGAVYAETGRPREAIAQLQLGLPADHDGSTYYRLARMYQKTGEVEKAAQAMQQVKALELQRRKAAVIALEDSAPSTP